MAFNQPANGTFPTEGAIFHRTEIFRPEGNGTNPQRSRKVRFALVLRGVIGGQSA